MKTKLNAKLLLVAILAALLTLTVAVMALADNEDRAEMNAYWGIVGTKDGSTLARAMSGEAVSLEELTAVTASELMAFANANQLPIDMARFGWYEAIAEALRAQGTNDATLALFLSMPETWRDSDANTQRRTVRRSMTEADIRRIADENGLPGGFVAWLLLEDEWYEGEWDDVDEWREGRSSWLFDDHAYAKEMRETYGDAVTDDDVERVLRQNGLRFDD